MKGIDEKLWNRVLSYGHPVIATTMHMMSSKVITSEPYNTSKERQLWRRVNKSLTNLVMFYYNNGELA